MPRFANGSGGEGTKGVGLTSLSVQLLAACGTPSAVLVEWEPPRCPARTLRLHLLLALEDGTNSVPSSCCARPAPHHAGLFLAYAI